MVLALALLAAASAAPSPALPSGSRLVAVNGHRLHVRTLGAGRPGPAVVLLSGPTGHWHSDTGWFALLQPLLAERHRVHAVDRAGQGFSDIVDGASYESFGADLAALVPALEREPPIVLSFASGNLGLVHALARGGRVHAALLVDPDALHTGLMAFYADQAEPFREAAALSEYVNAGKYDARAEKFRVEERAQLAGLVPPPLAAIMDWAFYDAMARQRTDRARILARFAETARYDRDVRGAAAVPWPPAIPVWTYDTDFERADAEAERDPARARELARWRDLSTEWMEGLPGGCRIGSTSREHLAVVAEAERLAALVDALAAGESCPGEKRGLTP